MQGPAAETEYLDLIPNEDDAMNDIIGASIIYRLVFGLNAGRKALTLLVEKAGLDPERFKPQMSPDHWPDLKAELRRVFLAKTRDEWCAIMEGSDVCFAPVLSILEAPNHPHNKARGTFVEVDGITQPAPSPRFSRTPAKIQGSSKVAGTEGCSGP